MIAAEGVRSVTERRVEGDVPLWVHPEWAERFPWLVQGTTGRGSDESPYDLGISGGQPIGEVLARWRRLRNVTGCAGIACSLQLHGSELREHVSVVPGMQILEGFDGHVTAVPGVALAVSVADCVPVSIVDPARRCVAILHAGWRGIAAGILDRGAAAIAAVFGCVPAGLWIHLGPAICGPCYEVGHEVIEALATDAAPRKGSTYVDLRAVLAGQALRRGVPAEQITRSTHCTRCSEAVEGGFRPFFSHRRGELARQVGVMGIRAG